MSPSTSTTATTSPPTFSDLGVRPLINCMGTYTIISGSRLVGPAAEAMVEASNHYVHMDELMDKVGQRLAELTGAEWGYITCGCAAALTQIAAAAMAGADPEKMVRLPDTTGMKDEIIVQKAHRNAYDYAMRMTGAEMVEVETRADLKAAINERTALFLITGDLEERSTIPIPEMIQVGKQHGIPSFVDAAAQRPDVPNRYLQMGADAVGMSTVPETITANHMGMNILGISCITNMAAGVLPKPLDHKEVIEIADRVKPKFSTLVKGILREM